jgi:hypothetical protein
MTQDTWRARAGAPPASPTACAAHRSPPASASRLRHGGTPRSSLSRGRSPRSSISGALPGSRRVASREGSGVRLAMQLIRPNAANRAGGKIDRHCRQLVRFAFVTSVCSAGGRGFGLASAAALNPADVMQMPACVYSDRHHRNACANVSMVSRCTTICSFENSRA